MVVVESVAELKSLLKDKKSVGFVPTMGALHNGHKSLIDQARNENNIVVVSIFVNPTQFLEGEDFSKYPRTFQKDREICRLSGVDYIFLPDAKEIYFRDEISITAPKKRGFILEGFQRVGHFNGVLQVVLKLFNIVKPHRAYFGKKDAQQLILIQQMVRDLFLDIEIVPMNIVRDKDMLALSSRNSYLSKEERNSALSIPQSLEIASKLIMSGEREISKVRDAILKKLENIEIEYVEILGRDLQNISKIDIGKTIILIAVRVGKTRLIDNLWI
jgi:pantoate--beta-alanine ligase